jgi:5-methylthioadenosine/S-adenosylhomocysteine deaminase
VESRSKGPRTKLTGALLFRLDGSVPARGDLWLEGSRITAVSPPDPPPSGVDSEERWPSVDASSYWIIPGFVATHVHLCQTPMRGAAEGLDLYRWLSQVVWPMEAAHDPDTMETAAELGLRQLLGAGVTSVLDMGTTRHAGPVLAAAARLGIRGYFGPALMDRGPDAASRLLRPIDESLADVADLAAQWEGYDDGRLHLALCPRFVPSVSDAGWKSLLSATDFRAFPVHTHASETREEVEDVRHLTGRTPPAYLASLAGSEERLKIAHCIWVDDHDRASLRQAGAAALHCPGSNSKLGSGICDTLALEEAGVPVSLGPDGAACNNRLDPWHEMRLAAYARSLLHGPQSVDPRAILRMATRGGAESIGLGTETGSLEAGKLADLVWLDPALDSAAWDAGGGSESPEAALIFAGSPAMVVKTVVGGRTVFDRTAPWPQRAEFMERVRQSRLLLAERSGLRAAPLDPAGPFFSASAPHRPVAPPRRRSHPADSSGGSTNH